MRSVGFDGVEGGVEFFGYVRKGTSSKTVIILCISNFVGLIQFKNQMESKGKKLQLNTTNLERRFERGQPYSR